jgi:uncharacterized repeat protein (TIGR04052 family)
MSLSTIPELWRSAAVLAVLSLSACTPAPSPVELTFALRHGDERISCTQAASGVWLTDLRFYVYDIAFVDESGNSVALELVPDGKWQDEQTALLDFEDGQGTCSNGSAEQNESLHGTLRGGPFRALAFKVGVPPEFNHSDPLTAKAPLNYMAMHWHWLNGYKFLRTGVRNDSDSFWLHLGSTRCDGSVTTGTHCKSGNRVAVFLDDFDPRKDRIVVDIGGLLSGVDIGDTIASDCSSGPDETACSAPFAALGLPFGDDGVTGKQQVFRSEKGQ